MDWDSLCQMFGALVGNVWEATEETRLSRVFFPFTAQKPSQITTRLKKSPMETLTTCGRVF